MSRLAMIDDQARDAIFSSNIAMFNLLSDIDRMLGLKSADLAGLKN